MTMIQDLSAIFTGRDACFRCNHFYKPICLFASINPATCEKCPVYSVTNYIVHINYIQAKGFCCSFRQKYLREAPILNLYEIGQLV